MSTVALADLEHAKSDYATRTLRSLLSLPVVRNTFASVFDGFPTRNTRLKDNLDLAQGVEEQSEPSESALSRYAQLVDKLRPETLRIHANVRKIIKYPYLTFYELTGNCVGSPSISKRSLLIRRFQSAPTGDRCFHLS